MRNPLKAIKEWERETKILWIVTIVFSAVLMTQNGMLEPLNTWGISNFIFYPFGVLFVSALLFLPVALVLELLERLINWIYEK